MTARTTSALRVLMLVVIATVALANAIGWVDPDLWIPFVCIIAVMGVGTRGGVLDALGFVLLEVAVVLVLGVATFSGSRDFVWAASVAVSVLAVGKIALLEMDRSDTKGTRGRGPVPKVPRAGAPDLAAPGAEPETSAVHARTASADEDAEPSQPVGTLPKEDAEHARSRPRQHAEPPPTPSAASDAAPSEGSLDGSSAAPRKRRDRDDPTPVRPASRPYARP